MLLRFALQLVTFWLVIYLFHHLLLVRTVLHSLLSQLLLRVSSVLIERNDRIFDCFVPAVVTFLCVISDGRRHHSMDCSMASLDRCPTCGRSGLRRESSWP